ncbi:MAG: hypothetical protein EXS06_02250 [Planctomycetaceae bacterium]|nr:hypothetical protein [Planctomycetaceae bacterium]
MTAMTRIHSTICSIALVAGCLLGGSAPTPAFAQGGVGLLAKPLDEQARPNPLQGLPQGAQNMAKNFANGGAAPGAQPAAPAADGPEASIMSVKYIPAYFITVLAAGLGLFVACKFSGRRRDV